MKKTGRPDVTGDTINPRHYKIIIDGNEIQVADIIDALDLNWKRAFAVKYLLRAGDKPEEGMTVEEKELDDLKKAVWYTKREIAQLERKIAAANASDEQRRWDNSATLYTGNGSYANNIIQSSN